MDRLAAMTVFITTVECGSLSAAGRRLDMPLATVSRKMSELEAHIGTRLLNRSTRLLSLTDAGQVYLDACKRILDEVEAAERTASGEYSAPKGELIVTAPVTFGRLHVMPVTLAFLRAYPQVDVRLVLGDRVLNLLDDHVDLAIRIGELPDSNMVATRIGEVRRVVCASGDYFAEHSAPQHPAELVDHSLITFDGLRSPQPWAFQINNANVAQPVHSRLTVNTADAAIDAAIAGLGITRVLSYQIAGAQRSGALQLTLQAYTPPAWPVHLLYAKQGRLPIKLRAFIDFATPMLRERMTDAC